MMRGLAATEPTSAILRRARSGDVSRCPVDASGVPAVWVERVAASPGQPTLVHFAASPDASGIGSEARLVGALASATGARVLSVGRRPGPSRPGAEIDDGVATWAWLLGEGCDPTTTAFVTTAFVTTLSDASRGAGILHRATALGLSLPRGGLWWLRTVNRFGSLDCGADLRSVLVHAGAVELLGTT